MLRTRQAGLGTVCKTGSDRQRGRTVAQIVPTSALQGTHPAPLSRVTKSAAWHAAFNAGLRAVCVCWRACVMQVAEPKYGQGVRKDWADRGYR
jgi:hypothetical protein